MFLVDTSVWIDYFNDRETSAVDFLDSLLAHPLSCGICDQILMELLQGAGTDASFRTLSDYLGGQLSYAQEDSRASHIAAADIYRLCRQRGLTIRSAFDCLIAQCAIEHDLTLLHSDRDFLAMAEVAPDLKQRHFLG